MTNNPQKILDESPMSTLQIVVVGLCVLLNALDGFDVLAISFASPGIADEWNIDRAALGIVLSMELMGMAVGSVLLGGVADRMGRRPTILICLIIMAAGMFAAALAANVYVLSAIRLITGLGIGGMLASINAMTAEFANARHRSSAVALMAAGYPLGVVLCGPIAALLLAHYDWRSVFVFGGIITALCIPLVLALLPESISYLLHKRPAGALERINGTLTRLKHSTISALPPVPSAIRKSNWLELFAPGLIRTTALLTLAYLLLILTFYFLIKWIPKIVVDMGFHAASAGTVLVWASVGGVIGATAFSLIAQVVNARVLTMAAMVAGCAAVVWFGQSEPVLTSLALAAAVAGCFVNAAIVGLYALVAQSFPTELRAGGTGFVIGLGRGGAILSPIIAGFLFEWGWPLPTVALWMGTGSLLAAGALLFLRYRPAQAGAQPAST